MLRASLGRPHPRAVRIPACSARLSESQIADPFVAWHGRSCPHPRATCALLCHRCSPPGHGGGPHSPGAARYVPCRPAPRARWPGSRRRAMNRSLPGGEEKTGSSGRKYGALHCSSEAQRASAACAGRSGAAVAWHARRHRAPPPAARAGWLAYARGVCAHDTYACQLSTTIHKWASRIWQRAPCISDEAARVINPLCTSTLCTGVAAVVPGRGSRQQRPHGLRAQRLCFIRSRFAWT